MLFLEKTCLNFLDLRYSSVNMFATITKNINSIYKEINKISLFFKNYVNKYLKQNTNFVYSKKSSLTDGLLYYLLKTKLNSTQQHITTNISLISNQH